MYKQVIKRFLCGNEPKETFKTFLKTLAIIGISIIGLSVIVALSYLLIGVGTNAFSQLFDDTVCTNWIWGSCGSYVQTEYGDSRSGIQLLLGIFVFIFIILLAVSIGSIISSFLDNLPFIASFFISYAFWLYTWAFISLFLGKTLSVHKIDGCQDYAKYGIIGLNMVPRYSQISFCEKIRNIGPNQGAIEDKSLPGDYSTCTKCLTIGFWLIYSGAVILPLLCLAIYILIVRFRRILRETRNSYETL